MEGERKGNTSDNDGRKTEEHEDQTVNQQPATSEDNPAASTAGNAWGWKDVAVGVAAGTVAVAATPVVLSAAGFSAGGIVAGSFASSIQSVVYGSSVATGSAFAALQSAGVAGIGTTASAAIGGATGAAAMLAKKFGERWYSSRKDTTGVNDQDQHKKSENDTENKKLNSSL